MKKNKKDVFYAVLAVFSASFWPFISFLNVNRSEQFSPAYLFSYALITFVLFVSAMLFSHWGLKGGKWWNRAFKAFWAVTVACFLFGLGEGIRRALMEKYNLIRITGEVLGILVVFVVSLLILRKLIEKDYSWKRLATVTVISVFCFFSYGLTEKAALAINTDFHLTLWLVFSTIVIGVSCKISKSEAFQTIITTMAFVMAAVPLLQYGTFKIQTTLHPPEIASENNSEVAEHKTKGKKLPSVYHIIMDRYARADFLKEAYDFDNTPFLNSLKDKGFYIADKAMSNYPVTVLSVPSTLAMEYLYNGEINPEEKTAIIQRETGGFGKLYKWFDDAGYFITLLRFSTPGKTSKRINFKYESYSVFKFGELESNLVANTPLQRISHIIFADMLRRNPGWLELPLAEKLLSEITTDNPIFAHIHVLTPHPPYRFTPECKIKPTVKLVMKYGAVDNNKKGYTDNILCGNSQALSLVDSILKKEPDAIIAIQSDHGAPRRVDIDWEKDPKTWPTEDIKERLGITYALKMPTKCQKHLYPEITSINTFKSILACINDEEPEFIPDRLFLENPKTGYVFEVTETYRKTGELRTLNEQQ